MNSALALFKFTNTAPKEINTVAEAKSAFSILLNRNAKIHYPLVEKSC